MTAIYHKPITHNPMHPLQKIFTMFMILFDIAMLNPVTWVVTAGVGIYYMITRNVYNAGQLLLMYALFRGAVMVFWLLKLYL